jgi:hypothetical protein
MRPPSLVLSATSFFCLSMLAGAQDPGAGPDRAASPADDVRSTFPQDSLHSPKSGRRTNGSLNGIDRRTLRTEESRDARAWAESRS